MSSWTSRVLTFAGALVLSLAWAMPASAALNDSRRVPLEFSRARSLRGIELRDAFNAPVKRAEVDRGIRRGVRAEEERAASLSKLPGLRQLLAYLDTLDQLAAKLHAPGHEGVPRVFAAAHRVPKRAYMRAPVMRAFALAPTVSPLAALNPLQLHSTPGRVRVLPLLL